MISWRLVSDTVYCCLCLCVCEHPLRTTDRSCRPGDHVYCGQGSVRQPSKWIQMDKLAKAGLAQKQSLVCSNQILFFFAWRSRTPLFNVFNHLVMVLFLLKETKTKPRERHTCGKAATDFTDKDLLYNSVKKKTRRQCQTCGRCSRQIYNP